MYATHHDCPHVENIPSADQNPKIIHINGNMIAADASNYNLINDPSDVAYLSCDDQNNDFISPDKMLNDLMAVKPKAIVLYTTGQNWCALSHTDNLPYTSILSMADSGEAMQALNYMNATRRGASVKVSITGNTTSKDFVDSNSDEKGGTNTTVAMSVLYTITGLITLLFLSIIATGAIRAHRHPERYGPRSALNGRSRQSRAKGIARAVLDTIPIVKFGNQEPPKPDPELELERTTDGGDAATEPTAPNSSEEQRPDAVAPTVGGLTTNDTPMAPRESASVDGVDPGNDGSQHLGCSICTEDFSVGEDVRVLPCKHQFHPSCIDPWLVNVSGTCPLWYVEVIFQRRYC